LDKPVQRKDAKCAKERKEIFAQITDKPFFVCQRLRTTSPPFALSLSKGRTTLGLWPALCRTKIDEINRPSPFIPSTSSGRTEINGFLR
jgi:hypothetical protein